MLPESVVLSMALLVVLPESVVVSMVLLVALLAAARLVVVSVALPAVELMEYHLIRLIGQVRAVPRAHQTFRQGQIPVTQIPITRKK